MNELRNRQVISSLLEIIAHKTATLSNLPIRIMEVCGTHTMSIHRHGLRPLLEERGIEMLSGPGCPVCITPDAYHEAAIKLVATNSNIILATFGDMTRVPTRVGSLQTAIPAAGSQVKIVYSPIESLNLAKAHPEQEVVFFGVGFETTIPSIALCVKIRSAVDCFRAPEKKCSSDILLVPQLWWWNASLNLCYSHQGSRIYLGAKYGIIRLRKKFDVNLCPAG